MRLKNIVRDTISRGI